MDLMLLKFWIIGEMGGELWFSWQKENGFDKNCKDGKWNWSLEEGK